MDLISIITVTYNCNDKIESTILSVINQTYLNIEYIIIDGGSTDGTIDIIKKYEKKISYWSSEKDNGIYEAMNKGILKAHGKWLNFMNSGDVFYSTSVLNDIFSENIPINIDLLYSDYVLFDANNNLKFEIASIEDRKILHQAIIYKKALHKWYGMYIETNPIIISDFLFFCSIPKNKYFKVPYCIAKFDTTGISNQGNWCYLKEACARYIFNSISFQKLYTILFKEMIHLIMPASIWKLYQKIKMLIYH